MPTTSQRVSTLERTVRRNATATLTEKVGADFAAALAAAANDPNHVKQLQAVAADIIRKGRPAAEKAALEEFLNRSQPAMSILDALRPQMFRLDASGKRLAEDASGEHIAVLIPNYSAGQDLLIDARQPGQVDEIKFAAEKAADIKLFGEPLALLSDLQWQLIIDRRYRDPAVHPFFAKTSPTTRYYPTSSPLLEKNGKPSPSGSVWAVSLYYGLVYYINPSDLGFVRGGRLVPASQF